MGSLLNEGSNGGSHGDTAMLDFDTAVVVEVILRASVWAILDESQRTGRGKEKWWTINIVSCVRFKRISRFLAD